MAHCGSKQCTLRALVVELDGTTEAKSTDVDVCPGAVLYGVRLESTNGPVTLRLSDTSWSIPADHVECFDVCGAAWPESAKLLAPLGSIARLTILYTQGSGSDAS